jgi:hypothetical protein
MGKNTPDRQDFIINNLRLEEELIINPDELKEEAVEEESAEANG